MLGRYQQRTRATHRCTSWSPACALFDWLQDTKAQIGKSRIVGWMGGTFVRLGEDVDVSPVDGLKYSAVDFGPKDTGVHPVCSPCALQGQCKHEVRGAYHHAKHTLA